MLGVYDVEGAEDAVTDTSAGSDDSSAWLEDAALARLRTPVRDQPSSDVTRGAPSCVIASALWTPTRAVMETVVHAVDQLGRTPFSTPGTSSSPAFAQLSPSDGCFPPMLRISEAGSATSGGLRHDACDSNGGSTADSDAGRRSRRRSSDSDSDSSRSEVCMADLFMRLGVQHGGGE